MQAALTQRLQSGSAALTSRQALRAVSGRPMQAGEGPGGWRRAPLRPGPLLRPPQTSCASTSASSRPPPPERRAPAPPPQVPLVTARPAVAVRAVQRSQTVVAAAAAAEPKTEAVAHLRFIRGSALKVRRAVEGMHGTGRRRAARRRPHCTSPCALLGRHMQPRPARTKLQAAGWRTRLPDGSAAWQLWPPSQQAAAHTHSAPQLQPCAPASSHGQPLARAARAQPADPAHILTNGMAPLSLCTPTRRLCPRRRRPTPVLPCCSRAALAASLPQVRRVLDQIRGRSYEEAIMILEYMPYKVGAGWVLGADAAWT